MILELPYPPSVNNYYATWNNRRILSRAGREYRELVVNLLRAKQIKRAECALSVSVILYPPTRQKFDLDNRMKSLLDALEAGGVYANDSQIAKLTIERREVRKGGEALVLIEPYHLGDSL